MPLDLAKCLKFAVNFILIGRGWDFVFHRFSLVCSGEKKKSHGRRKEGKKPGSCRGWDRMAWGGFFPEG